jgi:hypothetical protein
MGQYSSWVHGHAMVAEDNTLDPKPVSHIGFGSVIAIRPGFSRWLHIAVPTPVIDNDRRLSVVRVFLLWKIENRGRFDFVHVWDGHNRIATRYTNQNQGADDIIGVRGDHTNIDPLSTFELERPIPVFTGIGISFFVSTEPTTGPVSNDVVVTLTAAGADFLPS